MPAVEQLAVLVAAMGGRLDGLNEADTVVVMAAIRAAASHDLQDIANQIAQNTSFGEEERTRMAELGKQARNTLKDGHDPVS